MSLVIRAVQGAHQGKFVLPTSGLAVTWGGLVSRATIAAFPDVCFTPPEATAQFAAAQSLSRLASERAGGEVQISLPDGPWRMQFERAMANREALPSVLLETSAYGHPTRWELVGATLVDPVPSKTQNPTFTLRFQASRPA